jgi:hypothetical protein
MKFIQTVDGFFMFCHKYHYEIESLHYGDKVYYLAFYMGQTVAQYIEYLPTKEKHNEQQ